MNRNLNSGAARPSRRGVRPTFGLFLALLVLAGCSSPRHRAPIEARSAEAMPGAAAPSAVSPPLTSASTPDGGRTTGVTAPVQTVDRYVVKAGDTLIRIGLDTGQNWRDIARWNGLTNPNTLEVGSSLIVSAPPDETVTVATAPVTAPGRIESRPLEAKNDLPVAAPPAAASAAPAAVPAPQDPDETVKWLWPAQGPVLTRFDNARSKGLAIAGRAGDPVVAAADGRVVYAGSGLRGYGNLVIIKHNNTYLSAYAHNQSLLVKEDQVVRRGQKIAEMGSSDADRVQLHFEIRRQGKPVDPSTYLPSR